MYMSSCCTPTGLMVCKHPVALSYGIIEWWQQNASGCTAHRHWTAYHRAMDEGHGRGSLRLLMPRQQAVLRIHCTSLAPTNPSLTSIQLIRAECQRTSTSSHLSRWAISCWWMCTLRTQTQSSSMQALVGHRWVSYDLYLFVPFGMTGVRNSSPGQAGRRGSAGGRRQVRLAAMLRARGSGLTGLEGCCITGSWIIVRLPCTVPVSLHSRPWR